MPPTRSSTKILSSEEMNSLLIRSRQQPGDDEPNEIGENLFAELEAIAKSAKARDNADRGK